MNSLIEVEARSAYGTVRLYPVNDQAIRIATLAKRGTLDVDQLATLRRMGFAVRVFGDGLAVRIQDQLNEVQ